MNLFGERRISDIGKHKLQDLFEKWMIHCTTELLLAVLLVGRFSSKGIRPLASTVP